MQQQTAALLQKLAVEVNREALRKGDADAIHDLRVAIRRFSRGLRVFAPYYPDKYWKAIRDELRDMMHAAGAVRDCDIALACLGKANVPKGDPVYSRLHTRRREAGRKLAACVGHWKKAGAIRDWGRRLKIPVNRHETGDPRKKAYRDLPRLAADYFAEVREVLQQSADPKHLHAARLATKRFRYTLELYRSCYGKEFEDHLDSVRDVQQALGDVNDSVASRALLSDAMGKSPQRKMIREFLDLRADRDAADFRKEWLKGFDAPGRERWWKRFLAGRPPAPKNPAKTA